MNRPSTPRKFGGISGDPGDGVALSSDAFENDCLRPPPKTSPENGVGWMRLFSDAGMATFSWKPETESFQVSGMISGGSMDDLLFHVAEADRRHLEEFLRQDWRVVDGVEKCRLQVLSQSGSLESAEIVAQRDPNSRSPKIHGVIILRPAEREGEHEFEGLAQWELSAEPAELRVFRDLLRADAVAFLERTPEGESNLIGISLAETGSGEAGETDQSDFVRDVLSNSSELEDFANGVILPDEFGFAEVYARSFGSEGRGEKLFFVAGFRQTGACESCGFSLPLCASLLFSSLERKRESEALREMETLLQRAQRLATVGQFAAGVAHDFNNLITVIQGHTSFLDAAIDETDVRGRESLALITNATKQAVELSKQLLVFGKNGRDCFGEIDLNESISGIIQMVRRVVEENVEIDTDLGKNAGRILANSGMLGQIIMNLVVNARDAMPNGGRIRIATSRVTEGTTWFAKVVVRDNGPGMPAEVLDRIFDPFFSTKEEGKGTGLGLANVASIVERHGGKIDVSSRPGEGTAFEIYFPAVPLERTLEIPHGFTAPGGMESEEPKSTPADSQEECISGHRVLLVEDEASVRKLVRRLLEMHGCTVIEASSGKRALDLWPEVCKDVTVVISDIVMPEGVSGWDLAKKLHSDCPDIGILLTSGYNERPEDHGLENDPKIAFLQKPYEVKNLRQNIRNLTQPISA